MRVRQTPLLLRPGEVREYALAIIRGYRYDRRGVLDPGWKPMVIMTNMPFSKDGKLIGPYTYAEVAQLCGLRSLGDRDLFQEDQGPSSHTITLLSAGLKNAGSRLHDLHDIDRRDAGDLGC